MSKPDWNVLIPAGEPVAMVREVLSAHKVAELQIGGPVRVDLVEVSAAYPECVHVRWCPDASAVLPPVPEPVPWRPWWMPHPERGASVASDKRQVAYA